MTAPLVYRIGKDKELEKGDLRKAARTFKDHLSEARDALDTQYWEFHSAIGRTGYSSIGSQHADLKSLGEIADALDSLNRAIGALGEVR